MENIVTRSVFKVLMGGLSDTDQITAKFGFPFNHHITQKNFPLTLSEAQYENEIEIIHPGRSFSEEEGLKILKDRGLLRPSHEHGIMFAQQYGFSTPSEKYFYVIFLHESWLDPGYDRRVMCFDRFPGNCRLDLDLSERRFLEDCVIAGIRPHKPSVS